MGLLGVHRHNLRLNWHMLPLLVGYPLWGLVQQVLVQGMFVSNVVSSAKALRPTAAVFGAGVLFGCVHLPDVALSLATTVMGGVFAAIFLRHRNVWPLGVLHGVLGVPFYFWILGRDPWLEVLRSLGLP